MAPAAAVRSGQSRREVAETFRVYPSTVVNWGCAVVRQGDPGADQSLFISRGTLAGASAVVCAQWLLDTLDRLIKGETRKCVLVIDDDEIFCCVT